jgi:hypothetical protein
VTGLQLMSAAVHLDASWSPSTGREARREENAASRSHQGEYGYGAGSLHSCSGSGPKRSLEALSASAGASARLRRSA